jgi:trehalose 6-phosphate phosphatase
MRAGDVGVKVGAGDTLAGFRVDTPHDVAAALRLLLGARRAS